MLVTAIVATMLHRETKGAEHVDTAFLVLLGTTLLLANLGRVESLMPQGLGAVNLGELGDVLFLHILILDMKEQVADFLHHLLFLFCRTLLIQFLGEEPDDELLFL